MKYLISSLILIVVDDLLILVLVFLIVDLIYAAWSCYSRKVSLEERLLGSATTPIWYQIGFLFSLTLGPLSD